MTWRTCYRAPFEAHAYVVKGYLEQFGVPCLIDGDLFGVRHVSLGGPGEVRLLVREDFLEVARGLIDGRERRAQRPLRVIRGRKR